MTEFETRPSPRLIGGAGTLGKLPEAVCSAGMSRVLVVTDAGLVAAGHVGRAVDLLRGADLAVSVFDGVRENPHEEHILEAVAFAREFRAGEPVGLGIVALGGGSSMDTAKGLNFLLCNGGTMADYKGYGNAGQPMLPFVAVPTTAGTGSECQSYTVISSAGSHEKMACGDPKALARTAILDPELTVSQPPEVATLTALDALSHALETAVCTRRNPMSAVYSREGLLRISSGIEAVLTGSADLADRREMQLGAAFAGLAIENSMLGAAHASANPLTARFGLVHGHAVARMLPHVMRMNRHTAAAAAEYDHLAELLARKGRTRMPLQDWVEHLVGMAALPTLGASGLTADAIPQLAEDATRQWTGNFNPRPMTRRDFEGLYEAALGIGARV